MQFSPKSEKEALQDAMKGPDLEPHPMYNQVSFPCCAIPALHHQDLVRTISGTMPKAASICYACTGPGRCARQVRQLWKGVAAPPFRASRRSAAVLQGLDVDPQA